MTAQPAALAQPAEILVSRTVKDLAVRHTKIRHGSTSRCHPPCCRAYEKPGLARRGKDCAPRLRLPELGAWHVRADAPAGDDRAVLGDVGGDLQDPPAGDLRPPGSSAPSGGPACRIWPS